jgi:hypothetical protein
MELYEVIQNITDENGKWLWGGGLDMLYHKKENANKACENLNLLNTNTKKYYSVEIVYTKDKQ